MAKAKREGDTGKPTRKLKCKEILVVVEDTPETDAPGGPAIPNPPPTGHWCLCVQDGVIGWEPGE